MPPRMTRPPVDEVAFAKLLEGGRVRVLRFLQRLCGADAEDVLHDTFAKVLRYKAAWDPAQAGDGWLLRAAFRSFLDWRTRGRRMPRLDDAAVRRAPAAANRTTELREELERGLARLGDVERALLLGFHGEGLSLEELAKRHQLPVNTVKSHLHRARTKLVHPDDA